MTIVPNDLRWFRGLPTNKQLTKQVLVNLVNHALFAIDFFLVFGFVLLFVLNLRLGVLEVVLGALLAFLCLESDECSDWSDHFSLFFVDELLDFIVDSWYFF